MGQTHCLRSTITAHKGMQHRLATWGLAASSSWEDSLQTPPRSAKEALYITRQPTLCTTLMEQHGTNLQVMQLQTHGLMAEHTSTQQTVSPRVSMMLAAPITLTSHTTAQM